MNQFLKSKSTKSKKDNHLITHTRIGDKTNSIYGGSYICENDDENTLYDLIYKEVIQGHKMEYLTEKQLKDGAVYIDLDFRYKNDVDGRQHSNAWTLELLCVYLEIIKELMIVEPNVKIPIYVLQKDGVNRLADGSFTKDGIHIIIGMKMPNKLQIKMREMMICNADAIQLMEQLPLINSPDAVFDVGLSKGTTNVQLYGCRKPACDAYKLVTIYDASLDPLDNEWCIPERQFGEITKELFLELCVRKGKYLAFEMSASSKELLNPIANLRANRAKSIEPVDFENKDDLEKLVMDCLDGDRCVTGRYSDAFAVRQVLKNAIGENGKELYRRYTEKAYKDQKGSYDKYSDWEKDWDAVSSNTCEKPLTIASLHFWCKKDSPAKYSLLFSKQDTVLKTQNAEELFDAITISPTDVAFARYFNALYGDKFKCVDIKNKIFYEFTKACLWARDECGTPLRNILSNEMKQKFVQKVVDLNEELSVLDPDVEKVEYEAKSKEKRRVGEMMQKLENSADKNNILREICDMIKESDFTKNMNKELYILPLKHSKILDMRTLEVNERTILNKFDYECDTNYKDLDDVETADMKKYFDDLFCGKEDTVQVVLDILKSVMTGLTLRYIYFITGTGRNGKSVLFNILNAIFKKGMDVISKDLVLKKKSNTHLNTEVEKLDRCRLGYTTELKEDDKMNEPVIKAITGGDPINVRGICKTDETLTPTANLFVLTNKLPNFDVEQAICDRLIVIPFLNTFTVDKDFERKMIEKRELVFCYIMKYGRIMDKFELTEEMKVAKQDYIDANSEDYLKDFVDSNCERVDDKRIERDEFRMRYNEYCNQREYKKDKSTNTAFTNKMKLYNIDNKKSNGKTFYSRLAWKTIDDTEEFDG